MPAPVECPESVWQSLLAATDLSSEELQRYERHIESCPACQRRFDRAEDDADALVRLARRVGDPTCQPVEPELDRVMKRLHEGAGVPCGKASEEAEHLYFLRPCDRSDLVGMLGNYEVYGVIGQGGMGIVLKAFDPALHRLVAIKVMSSALAGSATARRRFTREAQAAAAVCHDHIVTVHGVLEADGLPYLVMQYLDGESLQARLDRIGSLELLEVVRIGMQTAAGLAAAHAQGLIHRDIKPANLILENGLARVKITDFGLARMVDDVQLTQNGVVAGTPEYMAPEQALGEPIDHRADLFSLGSVLYAMCTGTPPFRGSTAVAVLRQVSDQAPPPVRQLNAAVPAWLESFIGRLMEKNPADRFQSATEVATLLEAYLAHLRQPATHAAPELPFSSVAVSAGKPAMELRMSTRKRLLAVVGLASLSCLLAVGFRAFIVKQTPTDAGRSIHVSSISSNELQVVVPKNGVVYLLVNKNSGRCLSITDGSAAAGAKIVQGPTPDQAGDTECWRLVEAGNEFRLRNESSRLFLEIGGGNQDPGVQAIQWNDQSGAMHQHWAIEPVEDGYVLRAAHSQMVLSIGEATLEAGGRAVQWKYLPDVLEELWELRPAASLANNRPTQAKSVQERVWPLKGESENAQLLQFVGPDAEQCVHFEPDGLRITLPTGHPGKRTGTGIETNFPIQGDFEITMSFEIFKEPGPENTGLGTGVFLAVDLNTPTSNRASLTRGVVRDGKRFTTWVERSKESSGKPQMELNSFPTLAKSGRLRLVRVGSLLSHYVAEESSPDFTLLQQNLFGAEDVINVRLGGQTGGSQSSLDARITDLRICTGSLPGNSGTLSTARNSWLLAAESLGLGTMIALLSGLGVWLYSRQHRRAAAPLASVAASDTPKQSATDSAPVSFECSTCGKRLRAAAKLVGKKVKCPQCGAAALIPGTN
jgi:serine/threonine protein kinase/DNA-directed RNA polymerase subunit RPC12/RpoP